MNKTILIIVTILSLVISAYIGSEELPGQYSSLILLPLSSFVLYSVQIVAIGEMKSNISTVLIVCLTFVRYCLLPLLMVISGFQTIMAHASWLNGNHAILLMLYESIVITVALILANRCKISVSPFNKIRERSSLLAFCIFVCLAFCILVVVIFPDIKDIFKPITKLGSDDFKIREESIGLALGSVKRIMRTLFTVVFNVVRILVPVYLLKYILDKKWNRLIFFVVLLLVIMLQFMLLTTTFAEAIVSVLVILLSIYKLQPSLGYKINIFAAVLTIAVMILYFTVSYNTQLSIYATDDPLAYSTLIVSAYFTGVDNVSGSLNLLRDDALLYLKDGLIRMIPFNATIFGAREVSMQELFNNVNGTYGQIPSTVGNGYYYFGYVFAPLFSFILAYLSVWINRYAEKINYIWKYVAYLFISVVLSLGIAMYNEIISLSWVSGWGVPMLIIATICSRKESGYNGNNTSHI